jgi:hypothetical protein
MADNRLRPHFCASNLCELARAVLFDHRRSFSVAPISWTSAREIMIPGSIRRRGNLLHRPKTSRFGQTSILPALLFLPLAAAPSTGSAASAQKPLKDQLVGTWTLISISNDSGSKDKRAPVPPSAKYITTFEPGGRVTSSITGAGTIQDPDGKLRPSNLQAVVFSGTYAVDEADRSVTYQLERGSLSSTGQVAPKTNVTVKGNQFEQVSYSVGSSATTRAVWRRVK